MASIMMVLDGMQDTTYPQLDGKTPYDFGKGDSFREIEAHSFTGSLETTPPGFEPDTQTCVLTLLGVPAADIPSGRSYIEALAVGVPVGADDLVLRCNFIKVSPDGALEIPCCSAPPEVAKALRAEVAAQPGHTVTPVGSYKSLQCIAGAGKYLSGMVTSSPHNYPGQPLEQLLPSGNALADQLAQFSRDMLRKYAPYTVYNWAQSVPGELPGFQQIHGCSGAMVSKTDAPMGGAVAMGMACPNLPTATGDTDTDLAAKAQATLALAMEHDVVILHVGGPDEATHRQNAQEKADFIARMDRELIEPILDGCADGTRIMVTCDHVALCSTGGHTGEAVGFMVYEKGKHLSGDRGVLPGIQAVEVLRG